MIAQGGFSSVYLDQESVNKKFAIKIIDYGFKLKDGKVEKLSEDQKNKTKSLANNEILYTFNIKHKNTIRMYGYYSMEESFAIVLEYAGGKDLNYFQSAFKHNAIMKSSLHIDKIKETSQTKQNIIINYLSENVILFFANQICNVLYYFKSLNLVHRDLKLENIFLMKNFQIKVGDFQLMRMVKTNENSKTSNSGTLVYMAPELFNQKLTSPENVYKADNYAFGIILFKMLTNEFPLSKNDTSKKEEMSFEHVKNKTNDAINNTLNKTERCSTLRDLITKLLDPDENSRINIDAIRKHSFFKNKVKNKRILRLQESNEYDGCKMISELQKIWLL